VRFDSVTVWQPYVRAGVTWQNTDHFLLDAGFLEAPRDGFARTDAPPSPKMGPQIGAGVCLIAVLGMWPSKFGRVDA
jgi:hypothetical protein